jgi:putative SOS response-associated peptidase YedK
MSSSAASEAMCPAMCGRVHLSSDVEKLIEVFAIPPSHPAPNIAANWNVAPSDPLPRRAALGRDAVLGQGHQGRLCQHQCQGEGIDTRPAFREAFQRRRCLVPVDNFFEWKKTASGKQPYAIALADRGIMALAGLWETWRSPAGELVRSFAIVTTVPNALCSEIHNRMPVILKPAAWLVWLGEEAAEPPQLKELLAPYPAEDMIAWPVGVRVGNVKNNDPGLIEPRAAAD